MKKLYLLLTLIAFLETAYSMESDCAEECSEQSQKTTKDPQAVTDESAETSVYDSTESSAEREKEIDSHSRDYTELIKNNISRNVKYLEMNAQKGGLKPTLALYDFFQKVKYPDHKMSLDSKSVLQGVGLVAFDGKIHDKIQELLTGCRSIDYTELIKQNISRNLKCLETNAQKGELKSALALYDFFQKVKEPNHKMSFDSKSILHTVGLTTFDGKIHDKIQEIVTEE